MIKKRLILFPTLLGLFLVGCNGSGTSKATITVINGTGGGNYEIGKKATITATVPESKFFDYWKKDDKEVSKENPYTFNVTKSETYEAVFKETDKFTITVNGGTGGGTFEKGTSVTIKATIPEGQEFDYWDCNGSRASTSNPYTFTVTQDATFTAKFKSQQVTINVTNGTGGGTYDKGSSVTITANTVKDESFEYWSSNGQKVSAENPYTFTANEDATFTAVYTRGVIKKDGTNPIDITTIDVSKGGTITVDYKYVDSVTDKDKTVSLLFGSDESSCFGEYQISNDGLKSTYTGITCTPLDDGYNRLTICAKQLKVTQGNAAPTSIKKIMFKSFDVTKGIYFDVKSEPVEDASENRGVFEKSGNYNPIPISNPYTVSEGGTLVVDYKYVDPVTDESKGVSMFFGSDDTHRFGNYKLFHNKLETSYNGITFIPLDDGYYRIIACISKLNTVRSGESIPITVSRISFQWFEVTQGIYFDVNPKPKIIKTTEFKMSGDTFTVANFTDIHVNDKSLLADTGTTGKTIKYGIKKSNPDILLFSGDIAGSSSDLEYLFDYLDSFKIPYFIILGNHDHEGSLNYDTIANYAKKSEYGYIEKGPENFESNHEGNYTIKIKNSSDKLVHSLIMMSTGNKYKISDESKVEKFTGTKVTGVKYGSYNGYQTYCDGTKISGEIAVWDGIRGANQIKWYEDITDELGCDSTLICHAGFNEYVKAFEKYQDAVNKQDQEEIKKCEPIGKCVMEEQVCGTVENTGLFTSIKSHKTKNVICGHDHCNAYSLMYDGVRLTYSVKTGEGSYWKKDGSINGYTELKIDDKGATTLDQVYFNPLTSK